MLCPNCGKEFDGLTCPECGWEAPVQEEAQFSAAKAPAPEVPADPVPEETPAEPEAATAPDTDTESLPAEAEEVAEDVEAAEEQEEAGDGEATANEDEAAENGAEESEADGESDEEGETIAEEGPPKKKRPVLPIVLGAIAGLLLIIVVCLMVVLSTVAKTGKMPSFVTNMQNVLSGNNFKAGAIALEITRNEDGEIVSEATNEQLSYYYWGEYFYFIQNYGMSFDPATPLSQQQYSDDMTWEDYFLDTAKTSMLQARAIKAKAEEEGFTMPEAYQTQFESVTKSLADYAVQSGFTDSEGNGDVLAYVRDSYGDSSTEEGFKEYLYDTYYFQAYTDTIYNGIELTDEAIEEYFDANAETYNTYGITKSDQPNINIRHILIQPAAQDTTEDEGSAAEDSAAEEEAAADADQEAKELAEKIYKEWKNGDATEDSFAELASTYSTDTGSAANGGLIENVYPGQMVEEFNDWCFDKDRKAGDTAIVKTSYGYHIMYFSGVTDDYYWKQAASSDLQYEEFTDQVQAIVDQYSITETQKLQLTTPNAVAAVAAQYASTPTAPATTTELPVVEPEDSAAE